MKNFNLILWSSLTILLILIFSWGFVLASNSDSQYGVVPYGLYGGAAAVQAILVNKMVNKPGTQEFVDNLSPTDPHFKPNDQITFRISVKNTSNVSLINVTVKDFIPEFLNPIEGPGVFDDPLRVVTFNAGDFGVGEEKVFFIKAQVVSQELLPADKNVICLINKVQAFTTNVFDEDIAQFCIEKQVVKAAITVTQIPIPQQVPAAGPPLGLLFLTANAVAMIIGFFLIKRKQ